MKNPNKHYIRRKQQFEKLAKKQGNMVNFISVLRLITFIAGLGFTALFYKMGYGFIAFAVLFAFAAVFLFLAVVHSKVFYRKKLTESLQSINESSRKRTEGSWKSFEDSGEEYVDEEHSYSGDLDVFGIGSLFQMINSTRTYLGRLKLKNTLSNPDKDMKVIYKRQEAIEELSKNIGWRQRFMAEGDMVAETPKNSEELFKWGMERNALYSNKLLLAVIKIVPVITIFIILYFFLTFKISYKIPLAALAINFILLQYDMKNRNEVLNMVYKYKKIISAYDNMMYMIDKKKFKADYLNELKKKFTIEGERSAHEQIKELEKLVNLISDRANIVYFIENGVLLWDFQCMAALEKWKIRSGDSLRLWLETLGEFESLASLSILNYEHESWVIPIFEANTPMIKAKAMGHPLLGDNRVCNDIKMGEPNKILLVTGSNMAGKSTFLRTAGINLVLAYCGTKVCAESFTCAIMNIYTCMRISDNLEKSISSFYAEILRIKMLVKAAQTERVFFLLDEIFKGTNSLDRHTGAELLINDLCHKDAIGLVSTHDLELGELENTNSKVKNYHFREYYKNNELHFDYRLREGISTTRNALYLMSMAGIEVNN